MKKSTKDLPSIAETLDELACTAEGAAMLAELAETDATVRQKMPAILRAVCKQIANRLRTVAREVDEVKQ